MAGIARTLASVVIIVLATAAGYIAIGGWRDAILGGGVALIAWIVAAKMFERLTRFRSARVSLFDRALRKPETGPERPADLAAVERLFGWRSYAPDEFDSRIRPFLERLVERRLLERTGADLTSDPGRMAGLLGPRLRAALIDRDEVRADTGSLMALIDEVEAL
ncbi:MAG: hypothetical protein ACRDLB_16940 [Actinomycetota bacterium]